MEAILDRFVITKRDKVRGEARPKCQLLDHISKQLAEDADEFEPLMEDDGKTLKKFDECSIQRKDV